jgi:hypothetical protein
MIKTKIARTKSAFAALQFAFLLESREKKWMRFHANACPSTHQRILDQE